MKTRYLIKYTKGDEIKYVAHLDLMRTIQRILRRSELPVEYSKGFNPHIILSIAQPLSVGVASKGEYMDVEFKEEVDEKVIKDTLNNNTPIGIEILDVKKAKEKLGEKKTPPSMAAVKAADYKIVLKCVDQDIVEEGLKSLLSLDEWKIMKKTKKGEKEVNIRALIKNIDFEIKENKLYINTLVSCGSVDNLSAQIMSDYIKEHVDGIDKEAFVYIERQELYSYEQEKLVTLLEYLGQ
ncbi:TIGR03936 family radical SAM-associated protein [Clostridium novyi]|uniref:TIGR03936 family radical SAM-associated protein n=1 Tax=Clostridium novyi TaxID=1542 RepID=UPI0004D4A090|nr:TIGR03936 family radical SAM-associated protein [Clostridium novyi]KEH91056.1 radical SAM protein [Clostridium novyi A str. BKT29909]KEH95297.1 radical SAM protein [Clostridium novyi A str. GD211209]